MTVGSTEAVGYPAPNGMTGTGTTTGTTTTTRGTTSTGSADKDMFLQLLVAQMKYQDPMNPTDSGEFLAQSAQFTALEKMQAVADQTGALLGAQLAFGAGGLIGRQVEYGIPDPTGSGAVTYGSGVVTGVEFGPTGPVLTVDGVEVPLATVVTVTAPATSPASTDPTGTTTDPTSTVPDPTSTDLATSPTTLTTT